MKAQTLFTQDAVESATFSPDTRSIAIIRKDGVVCIRSTEDDGRVLFEVSPAANQKEHDNCAFTSDGTHLLTWNREGGAVRLLSAVDGSVRWSIQLPNWTADELMLHKVRACPGQLDRFLCDIEAFGVESEECTCRLLDVQVRPSSAVQLALRVGLPVAAAAGPVGPSAGGVHVLGQY